MQPDPFDEAGSRIDDRGGDAAIEAEMVGGEYARISAADDDDLDGGRVDGDVSRAALVSGHAL